MRQLFVTLLVAAAVVGCDADPVRSTVDDLYDLMTPPMGWRSVLIYNREPTAVTASWELESSMTWKQYDEWARDRLAGRQFTVFRSSGEEIGFRRSLDGDVQLLEFRVVVSEPKVRIAAAFTSRAF